MTLARTGTLAGVLLAVAAAAHAATCTVQPGGFGSLNHVPSVGEVPSPVPAADGLVIPVDVDAAAGTILVRREGLPALSFGSPGGPVEVALAGPPVAGRIDAGGHLVLDSWDITTDFAGIALPVSPAFTTGPKSVHLLGRELPSRGVPLDFATGLVTLDGNGLITSAPIVSEPVVSNFRIVCRIEPIPDRAALPAAATLATVRGKAKVTGAASGDTLQLRARLVPGAAEIALEGRDVIVRLADAQGVDVAAVVTRAGTVSRKGKRRLVKDTDGTQLSVYAGRKGTGDAAAPTSGVLSLARGKSAVTLALTLRGLDLTALAGPLVVTVAVGDVSAERNVAAQGSGKARAIR